MARKASSGDGDSYDDAWFEATAHGGPASKNKRAVVALAVALVALLIVGVALGAFSSSKATVGPDLEGLKARARAADKLEGLSDSALIGGLEALPLPPVPVADVVSADAASDVGGDGVAAADAGPSDAQAATAEAATVAKMEADKKAEADKKKAEADKKKAEDKKAEADKKPVEAKPVETKPIEAKPVETKPAETKPAETKVDPKLAGAPLEQALAEGKGHLDAGRWADARAAYDKALSMAPGSIKALAGRGRAYYQLRQLQPALKDLKAVLEADPKNPAALITAGAISQELGQRDDARRFYQRYLEAWPAGRQATEVKALLERL
jgi:tetratricopeptide (TPR) repeat protein